MNTMNGYAKNILSDSYVLTSAGGHSLAGGYRNYSNISNGEEWITRSWGQYYAEIEKFDTATLLEQSHGHTQFIYRLYVDNTEGTQAVTIRYQNYQDDSNRGGDTGNSIAAGSKGWLWMPVTVDANRSKFQLLLNHSSSTTSSVKVRYVTLVKNFGDILDWTVNPSLTSTEEFIVGTQTSATGSWTGVTKDANLYHGKKIIYWLPYNGSGDASLNLTLSGTTTTGAIPIYKSGTSRVTTHYSAGSAIRLIYLVNAKINGAAYTGWWADADYNDGVYRGTFMEGNVKAETAITGGNICCGTSAGYNHLKSGKSFDITYPILYISSSISAGSAGSWRAYTSHYFSIATTQSITLTAYKEVFIKGTLNGTKFTPVSTAPITQTRPSVVDNYQYILLGYANSSTHLFMTDIHPIFEFKNGVFEEISSFPRQGYMYHTMETSSGIVCPFINNDLAHLKPRGGSLNIYKTSSTDYTALTLTEVTNLTPTDYNNVFDAGTMYSTINNVAGNDIIIFDVTLPSGVLIGQYDTAIYCQTHTQNHCILGMYWYSTDSNNPNTSYTQIYNNTSYNNVACVWNKSYTYPYTKSDGSSATGRGANKLRIVLKVASGNTYIRLTHIGAITHASYGGRAGYMSRGIDDPIYRNITPNTSNVYQLGTSSKKWNNVYATTFTGNLVGNASTASSSTTAKKFERIFTPSSTSHADLNTCLAGGGITYNYSSTNYWENGPTGMSYGQVLQLSSGTTDQLSGQLAWDVNHNSTTDTTNKLWWRATDDGTWTESVWHRIAFFRDLTKTNVGLSNVENTAFYKRQATVNGTTWDLAGTTNSLSTFTIYAPTSAGTSDQILKSSGGVPSWANQSTLDAGKINGYSAYFRSATTGGGTFLYRHTKSVSLTTTSVWYVTITLTRSWDPTISELMFNTSYTALGKTNSMNTFTKLVLYNYSPASNNKWYTFATQYNENGISGLYVTGGANPTTIYLKMVAPATTGTVQLWSPFEILTMTASTTAPSGITFNTINAGGFTNFKITESTIGGATSPIYLNAGLPTACTGKTVPDIKTASSKTHTNWSSGATTNSYVVDVNMLSYWNGAFNASNNSNLTYCVKGAFGDAAIKGVSDSSSASAISTGTSLVTERDVYYGLPTINNSHSYTSSTSIYAPTAGGTSGYYLKGNGTTAAPVWQQYSSTPTASSTTLITSGGVYTALQNYLPLAGGTTTGLITLNGNTYNDTLKISNKDYAAAYAQLFMGGGNDFVIRQVIVNGGTTVDLRFNESRLYYTKNLSLGGNATITGSISAQGAKFYTNANGAFWTSDRRFKTDIKSPVKSGLLEDETGFIRKFRWKENGNSSYGYIAQELLQQIPEAVDYDAELNKYSVNYDVAHSAAIAQLVIKIKELEKEINQLKLTIINQQQFK